MADVKWIKIVTDIFDDEKILLIESLPEADSIIVIWFKLLCLAGKQNNSGVFIMGNGIPYTDQMLATIFRRKEATVKLALKTFEQFGMIEIINGAVTIPNWGKHQSLEMIKDRRDYMREYMQEYRRKQGVLTGKANCKVYCKPNVNLQEEEGDIDREVDREVDTGECEGGKPPKTPTREKRFSPPSSDEVRDFCREHFYDIDAEQFVDFYTANGWKQGRGKPIVDWKAAVRTWVKRRKQEKQGKGQELLDMIGRGEFGD